MICVRGDGRDSSRGEPFDYVYDCEWYATKAEKAVHLTEYFISY